LNVRPYPLKFYEIYKPKIWGGRRMEQVLGKSLPAGAGIGESWEISDHFDDVSVIRNGALEGATLRETWRRDAQAVLGKAFGKRQFQYFPLLVKFIDASEILSVQVHPDDAYAKKYDPNGDEGKHEAWYILDAAPGARLVAGVKEGVTKGDFKRMLEEGRVEECLHSFKVKAGDLIHIAPGTVHAIGSGILLCEIQQTSDATYRIWDWGRMGSDGRPRPLHMDHALEVIDFERGPVKPLAACGTTEGEAEQCVLDKCEFFVVERVSAEKRFTEASPPERFHVLVCIEGGGSILADGDRHAYSKGDTMLVPGATGQIAVEPTEKTVFLKAYMAQGAD